MLSLLCSRSLAISQISIIFFKKRERSLKQAPCQGLGRKCDQWTNLDICDGWIIWLEPVGVGGSRQMDEFWSNWDETEWKDGRLGRAEASSYLLPSFHLANICECWPGARHRFSSISRKLSSDNWWTATSFFHQWAGIDTIPALNHPLGQLMN